MHVACNNKNVMLHTINYNWTTARQHATSTHIDSNHIRVFYQSSPCTCVTVAVTQTLHITANDTHRVTDTLPFELSRAMANIAVSRVKREFAEVVKSEEVRLTTH